MLFVFASGGVQRFTRGGGTIALATCEREKCDKALASKKASPRNSGPALWQPGESALKCQSEEVRWTFKINCPSCRAIPTDAAILTVLFSCRLVVTLVQYLYSYSLLHWQEAQTTAASKFSFPVKSGECQVCYWTMQPKKDMTLV